MCLLFVINHFIHVRHIINLVEPFEFHTYYCILETLGMLISCMNRVYLLFKINHFNHIRHIINLVEFYKAFLNFEDRDTGSAIV